MNTVKNSEQICCTCDHWIGLRASEEDGFVYAFEEMEGICNTFRRVVDGIEFNRTLTFSDTSCKSWKRWAELDS